MLIDILMESLMSMDENTLDRVLESCSAEEIDIIDAAIEMKIADRNDPDVQEYMRKRKESREELMRRFPNNPKLRKKVSETTKRSDKEMCRMSIKNREDYKNDIERIKNASNERLNKGLDEINSYFNPKIQALQKNIDELKGQK